MFCAVAAKNSCQLSESRDSNSPQSQIFTLAQINVSTPMLAALVLSTLSLDTACGYLRAGSLWLPAADCHLGEVLDFGISDGIGESGAGLALGRATAGALVETEPCKFHLLTLGKGGALRNLVLDFDAEIEFDCQEVFVAPFSSAAGKLENVTITGQIRVKAAEGARVHLGAVLGHSLGTELAGVRTSLAFLVNGAEVDRSSVALAWEDIRAGSIEVVKEAAGELDEDTEASRAV